MKIAILLVAYGAENHLAQNGLKIFEQRCRRLHPELPLRWAYSSGAARERIALKRRKSDSVSKALRKLRFERYDAVAIQPLQLIAGKEYAEVSADAREASEETGLRAVVGEPLMRSPEDAATLADALLAALPADRLPDEDIVFMGHGAKHSAAALYQTLAERAKERDRRVFVGAMSGARGIDSILASLTSTRVWLLPLFANIGGHALTDMAGSGSNSWLSRIEASGRACAPALRGLAETESVGALWLRNLSAALARLENIESDP